MTNNTFRYGEKVIFIPENKIYDFGYMRATKKAIIYTEGNRNMQDSYAVDPADLKKLHIQEQSNSLEGKLKTDVQKSDDTGHNQNGN